MLQEVQASLVHTDRHHAAFGNIALGDVDVGPVLTLAFGLPPTGDAALGVNAMGDVLPAALSVCCVNDRGLESLGVLFIS
jgi:hypothetical protein